jgi:inhibitor of growth protein 3
MPRDDLSIDFVRKMPVAEAIDPGLVLDDWINRVQNLPEEIRFIHDEILEKDRLFHECVRAIDERDSKIQKFIKSHGAHEPNSKEDALRAQIRERYAAADKLSAEKIVLAQRMQVIMDKHLRSLDAQIKLLFDRNEPGFTDPDEVPSLMRASAANHTAPSLAAINPSATPIAPPMSANPMSSIPNPVSLASARLANPQVRSTQAQQQHAASAPASPAATMLLSRQAREGSASPAPKRPRTNTGLGALPASINTTGRPSSTGPGTPKGIASVSSSGHVRSGSMGPRAGSIKGTSSNPSSRRGTPGAGVARKKLTSHHHHKSSLSRLKKSSRNSPASAAESELSDAESASAEEEAAQDSADGAAAVADIDKNMVDMGYDEANDDRKYCICQTVSYGPMVACDNETCPYEWFHMSCVGLKSVPNGEWFCQICVPRKEQPNKAAP